MLIRTERPDDHAQVHQLNVLAFENRKDEAELVERIRSSGGFIPELSLVAEENGEILGHILLSRAKVIDDRRRYEVIVIAPVAVMPGYQRKGIGSELIQEGLKRCKQIGFGLVLLIGHPDYYPRFGFVSARTHGLELTQFDVSDEVFMVCELRDGELDRISGELIYPKTFFKEEV